MSPAGGLSTVHATTWRMLLKRHRHMAEETQFPVHVSQGSAETLLRRGGITNHHSMLARSLSSISAKKLSKSVDVHWSYSVLHQCRFFRHSVQSVEYVPYGTVVTLLLTLVIFSTFDDFCTTDRIATKCQHIRTINDTHAHSI